MHTQPGVPINGFAGYFVTEQGEVYSRRGRWGRKKCKRLEEKTTAKGYKVVCLYTIDGQKSHRRVHRLVLEAFIGPCPEGMQARHKDGNAANNCLGNLCWGTKLENEADRRAHGTIPRGEINRSAKLTEYQVQEIRLLLGSMSMAKIAKAFGVSQRLIHKIAHKRAWAWLGEPA